MNGLHPQSSLALLPSRTSAPCNFSAEREAIVTRALSAIAALAVAKPKPDVPPRTTTWWLAIEAMDPPA